MKKRTLSVLVVLSMVISMLGTALPAQAYAPPTPTAWTFMVYMAADNNLNDAAIVDLNEMEMAPSSDQVNVIALMDLYGPANTTAYRITHDTNPDAIASTVFTPPGGWSWATEANVGDPATLTEFVTKTAMAYPAQHYAVVLWNHGSGIRALTMSEPEYKYIALDETSSNSYIDIPELAGALDLVNTQIGGPLGVVAFDACLMQMAEIAHQLIGNTQMLVGSEEVVPGDGFPYDAILGDLALNPMMSCRQLSEAIVGRYAEEYAANEVYGNFTMSALDLLGMFSPGMGPISADISALGDAMATSGEWDSIFAARLTAESFNDADYIDLKDFAQRVNTMVTNPAVKAAAATLINDLGLTVFAKANGPKHPDAGGLSIYMPIAGEIDSVYSQVQFVTDTTWDEFLTWFLAHQILPPDTWATLFNDPQGDQFYGAGPDIAGFDMVMTGQSIYGRVRSYGTIDYANFQGYTLLDVDQNPDTGTQSEGGRGFDYMVYVTQELPIGKAAGAQVKSIDQPWAALFRFSDDPIAPWKWVAGLPLAPGLESYWAMVPLALLDMGSGPDDGNMNVLQVAGTRTPNEDTDMAPNAGPIWHPMFLDDADDVTTPANDITQIEGFRTSQQVGFRVHLLGTANWSNFGASIYLDTDLNPATGFKEGDGVTGATNDIGADYRVVVVNPVGGGPLAANVLAWDGATFVNPTPITLNTDPAGGFFDVLVPLDALNNDEGNMNWVIVVRDMSVPPGTYDKAPNQGHGKYSEPPWNEFILDVPDDGTPDLLAVDSKSTVPGDPCSGGTGFVYFRVVAAGMDYANVRGDTYLDLDNSAVTGFSINDIGADYSARVTSTPAGLMGELMKWDPGVISFAPAGHFGVFIGADPIYSAPYYWFGIPIEMLGMGGMPDDGFMDVVQTIGTLSPDAVTDTAPNVGHGAIQPKPIEEVLADGMAWLVNQQQMDTGLADYGSFGTSFKLAETALAIYKIETYAWESGVDPLSDEYPYKTHVEAGLDYIISKGHTIDVSDPQPHQAAGYVDSLPTGIGVLFHEGAGEIEDGGWVEYPTYNTAICLLAIAAARHPERTVAAVGNPLDGMTFDAIIKNTVDYFAWGQTDFGVGRGGWNYGHSNAADFPNERSDQSNNGWVTISLAAAEDAGAAIPGWLRSELGLWVDIIQDPPGPDGDPNDGGAYYEGPTGMLNYANALRTGNLLQQFAFLGDTASTPRVQAALGYLERHWDDFFDAGWKGCPDSYQTTYTVMKGLEALGITEFGSPAIDWYSDLNKSISSQQKPDGGWPVCPHDQGDRILSTAWAMLTLEKEIPPTRQGPDLIVSEKHEEWVSEALGQYRIIFTIKNIGNAPASADMIFIKVAIDGDVFMGGDGIPFPMNNFGPGEEATLTLGYDVPFQLSDTEDTIVVSVDSTNAIEELNEENNTITNGFPARVDLAIVEKHENWEFIEGSTYRVSFTLRNTGNVTIPGGHEVGIFIDEGASPYATIKIFHAMMPGEEVVGSIGQLFLTDGSDTIRVMADATEQVTEADEDNNSMTNTWPGDLPNLIVSEKHETWVNEAERTYQVHFTIKNVGLATVHSGLETPSHVEIGLMVNGFQIEVLTLPGALDPNQTWSGTFDTVLTVASTDSPDDIRVTADCFYEVYESDETDNTRINSWPALAQGKPDLVILGKWETPEPGNPNAYVVHVVVQNRGPAPVMDAFTLTISAGDNLPLNFPVPGPMGETSMFPPGGFGIFETPAFSLSPPDDLITAEVDSGHTVDEIDEDNNTFSNTFPAMNPLPDLIIVQKHEEWVNEEQGEYSIGYLLMNVGQIPAMPPFKVGIYQNGELLGRIIYNDSPLGPGEVREQTIAALATLELEADEIKVWADDEGLVPELNDLNNAMINQWPPQGQPPQADIAVTSPIGGENWAINSVQTIFWTSTNVTGNVTIQISRNGGALWTDLYTNIADSGSQAWTVAGPEGVGVLIKVFSVANPAIFGISGGFNITSGGGGNTITLASPIGGENWEVGTDHNITWTGTPTIANVKIELCRNYGGGNTWETLVASTANDGSWTWTIGGAASNAARVRISDAANASVFGMSSNNFTIWAPSKPDLVVLSKSETWLNKETGTYRIDARIKNAGIEDAEASQIAVRFEVDGEIVATQNYQPSGGVLAVDSFFDIFTEVTMEGDSDVIVVTVDPLDAIDEADENNNTAENTLYRLKPDLIVSAKSEPWVQGQEGVKYTVNFTVQNIGEVTANISNIQGGLPVDLYIDDVKVDTVYLTTDLAPLATVNGSFVTERELTEGSDPVKVVVDPDNALPEEDETNNERENVRSTSVDIWIEPSTQTVGVNQYVTVEIWVDASLREIDTIQTYLDYDTSVLKVVDAAGNVIESPIEDAIDSGAIVLGTDAEFGFTARNQQKVDNTGAIGKIDLALGIASGEGVPPVSGRFMLATVRFKALQVTNEDVTHIVFQLTDELRTTKAIRNAVDVKGSVENATVTVIEGVQVILAVTLQRTPGAVPTQQVVTPMKVWVHEVNAPWDTGAANDGAVLYVETQTDSQSKITLVIPPGNWDIRVKGKTSLKVLKRNIAVTVGMGEVAMGVLWEGDTNGDNVIDGVDYSTVVMCYGTSTNPEDATYLDQSPFADLNNDGVVEGLDYSRLLANFLKKGADMP